MGTHPIFESDFDCLTEKNSAMNTRLKEIVKSLPRVKSGHIKRDYTAPERAPRPLSRAERTAFERNSPIFLWDGSPVMIQDKPSIGAEHRFKKGFFRGVDGRKQRYLGDMRFRGTRFVPAHEEQMPNNFWHLDDRTNKLYEPVTLGDIQRLVDLGRLDSSKLIDINALVNARLFAPADLMWSEDIMGIRLGAGGEPVGDGAEHRSPNGRCRGYCRRRTRRRP